MDYIDIKHADQFRDVKEGDLLRFIGRPLNAENLRSAEIVIFTEDSGDHFEVQTIRRMRYSISGVKYIQKSVYDMSSIIPWHVIISDRELPDFHFLQYDQMLREKINCEM